MGYPEYYRKACEILRCKPEASFEAKKARFHRMVEQWQQECHHCMGGQGQQPQLSETRLAELKGAIAVIYEFEGSLESRSQPSNWRERFWQDLSMGQLIPEFSLGEDFNPWIDPVFANGIMYAGYRDFSIGAIDISEKEKIWRFPTSGRITAPVLDQDVIVFGSADKHVYAVEASTGRELWRFRATAQIHYPAAVEGGSVFVSAGHTQFHCLDLYNGCKKWSVRADPKVIGRPFPYEDVIFQFDYRAWVHCFDASAGECRWIAKTKYIDAWQLIQVGELLIMTQKPCWAGHLSYYDFKEMNERKISELELRDPYSARETEFLVAFQIMTGSVAWMLPMPGSIGGLFSSDGIIYGTCHRAHETSVFAVEGETGRELWKFGLKPKAYGRVLAHDGRIYYADHDGNMYSVAGP